MSMINNCNPRGPFNTPLDNDGNLVFTEEIHGINAVVNWQEYFNVGLTTDVDSNVLHGGGVGTTWPIIVDDSHEMSGDNTELGWPNNTAGWRGDNEHYLFCPSLSSELSNQKPGWTLTKYLPFSLNSYVTIPFKPQLWYDEFPNRTLDLDQYSRHMHQFYDFSIFSEEYLNESYSAFSENGTSDFFTNISSGDVLFDYGVGDSFNFPGFVYYWVKVGCIQPISCRVKLVHPNTGGIITGNCKCIPDLEAGDSFDGNVPVSGYNACFSSNYTGNRGGCYMPSTETGAWDTSADGSNISWTSGGVSCISLEEGGLTRAAFSSDISNFYDADYELAQNQGGAGYGQIEEQIYTDDIHPAFDYKVGCRLQGHPFYNPEVCFYSDGCLGTSCYSDYSCPTEDCNGTPVEDCAVDGCSVIDECGQCICGGYAIDPFIQGNFDEIIQDTCKIPFGLLDDEPFVSTDPEWISQYGARNCYADRNGRFCIDIEHDQCDVCSGNNFNHEFNSDDLGCGCFADPPTWFFLDRDMDCNVNEIGLVENSGGTGDDQCDVYLGDGKLFCKSFSSILTDNTCNFNQEGNIPGQPTCVWTPFNPRNYVDCNISDLDWTFPELDGEILGQCYFDSGNNNDEIISAFDSVEGCMDENAVNYDSSATFGIISELCIYELPDGTPLNVGDVIFRLDYLSHIEPIAGNLPEFLEIEPRINIGSNQYDMDPFGLFGGSLDAVPYVLLNQSIGSTIKYNYSLYWSEDIQSF